MARIANPEAWIESGRMERLVMVREKSIHTRTAVTPFNPKPIRGVSYPCVVARSVVGAARMVKAEMDRYGPFGPRVPASLAMRRVGLCSGVPAL